MVPPRCQGAISSIAFRIVVLLATSGVIAGPQPRLGPVPQF